MLRCAHADKLPARAANNASSDSRAGLTFSAAAVGVEELEALPDRRNLMVTVPGTSDEPRLVYISHMDTVTLGEGWSGGISPLGAQVIGDDLYGRGSCDM